MKFKTLLLLVLILALAATSQATFKWSANIKDSSFVLTKTCPGIVGEDLSCIPDSSAAEPSGHVYVYVDVTGNGPDHACTDPWWQTSFVLRGPIGEDYLAPLCAAPYPGTCAGAPSGELAFKLNSWRMNGGVSGPTYGCGNFTFQTSFQPSTSTYTGPMTFYCVVYYEHPTLHYKTVWISQTWLALDQSTPYSIWLQPGTNSGSNYYFPNWCCVQVTSPVPPCTPSAPLVFGHNGSGPQEPVRAACVTICPTEPFHVCVGPVNGANHIPHIQVHPGCTLTPFCDVPTCPPAVGYVWADNDETGWTWDGQFICKDITWGPGPNTGGCVCVTFDFLLAATIGNVDIVPMDNSVKLTWTSLTETNMDKWVVKRDNVAIYQVDATNTPTSHTYTYTDETAVNGRTYTYTLVARNTDQTEEVMHTASATPSLDLAVVTEYALRQNYPNPFNPTTMITYDVLNTNLVSLKIYNAAGQEVSTLVNEVKTGGRRYSVNFDAANLPSGLYFYSIKMGNEFSATKKMLLVK